MASLRQFIARTPMACIRICGDDGLNSLKNLSSCKRHLSNRNDDETKNNNNHRSGKSVEMGQSVSVERRFTAQDVQRFAELTGDNNALHFDDKFAANFNFSKAIVHGALINGIISATIGTILPGQGSILLQQDLHFPNPLYVDECFVTTVTIAEKRRNIYFCKYHCVTTANGTKVVEGMAKILFRP